MFGPPALRLLVWLKLRGAVRAQVRRLRTPRNWIFLILGVGLFALWAFNFLYFGSRGLGGGHDPQSEFAWSRILLCALGVLTLVGSFNHRGLYLPKQEIELAFSAPLARSDLVRYRLTTNLLRSIIAGLVVGVGAARKLEHPGYAFAGTFAALMFLPIVGQAAAILLGDAENRWTRLASRVPARAITLILGVGLVLLVVDLSSDEGGLLGELAQSSNGGAIYEQPWYHARLVQAILWPTLPWAHAINAAGPAEFAGWFALCAALWVLAFELTARIGVDFRELSLATSADIARRLKRLRSGGAGVAASKADVRSVGWRVPWLFGRGPFGAIAWLKLVAMLRKARGTLLFSVLVVGFVAVGFPLMFEHGRLAHDPELASRNGLLASAMIAAVGSMYLAAGLRFDFRQDLELMDLVKSWPVHSARIFLATILPEVLLISLLLATAIVVRSFFSGFHPVIAAILLFQPLVTFAWIAIDNAVYLFSPVRFTPGQEGALQHMGRSLLLMLLRLSILGVSLALAGGPAAGLILGADWLGIERGLAWVIALVYAWGVLLALDAALVVGGGWVLRRFDVARDRG